MSGSINKVILVGNVGNDPEIRSLANGGKVAQLSIATSESWRDKNTGEKKERTAWHKVVVFSEGLVKLVESYVKKGSKLYVEGHLQTRKWHDQSGNDRYSTEIVLQGFNATITLLDSASGGNRPPVASSPDDYGQTRTRDDASAGRPQAEQPPAFESGDMTDDTIPF